MIFKIINNISTRSAKISLLITAILWVRGTGMVSCKNLNQGEKRILSDIVDGPDVIRTHDLPVISRAHHRAMLRAQKFA